MSYSISITGDDKDNKLVRAIALLGCTGNGKSSTGNSILGEKKFLVIKSSFRRVTTECGIGVVEMPYPEKPGPGEKISTPDGVDSEKPISGTFLYVIDTPGLFDSSSKGDEVLKEIAKGITFVRASGINAVLMVVSLMARFTEEQAAVIETLKYLFGKRIVDYMIVAFTGGDHLEKSGKTLEYFLSPCPKLQELLQMCGNRKIVFNNKTKDEKKLSEKREELLRLIEQTMKENGGKPYTYELFSQLEKEREESKKKKMTDEEIQERVNAEIIKKLKKRDEDYMNKLKEDLEREKEKAAAKGLENNALNDQIRELQRRVAKAEKEAAERWSCAVL